MIIVEHTCFASQYMVSILVIMVMMAVWLTLQHIYRLQSILCGYTMGNFLKYENKFKENETKNLRKLLAN